MRKHKLSVLVLITVAFAGFTLGFLLGNSRSGSEISVSVPEEILTSPTEIMKEAESATVPETTEQISFPININLADKEAFMALPGIGDVLAERILSFRQEHGDFQAVEELLLVEGIGKKRMEEILDLITLGGQS